MQETQVQSLDWKDPLEGAWQPTPVFLPGEFHGQRSQRSTVRGGYKELGMIEQPTLSQINTFHKTF